MNDHDDTIGKYDITDIQNLTLDELKKLAGYYGTQYEMEEETLYAVNEQIEWAHNVYMDMNEELNSTEKELLKKVIETGKYISTDREMLNELLKKYNYVRKVTLGKIDKK